MRVWKNLFGADGQDKIDAGEIYYGKKSLESIIASTLWDKGRAISYFNSNNFNDFMEPGIFHTAISDNVVNSPNNAYAWVILIIQGSTYRTLQLVWRNTAESETEIWVRTRQNNLGVWQNWAKLV